MTSLGLTPPLSLLFLLMVSAPDLQVEMIPDEVVEGNEVTLTCKNTSSPTVSWYKNGTRLSSSFNPLRLRSVSRMDSGDYSCAAQGEDYRSPAVTLDVQYPPKSISVSISPSGEVVEGSSVTLTCSSDANPPAEFNWFKETTFKSKEKIYTIKKISSEDSGEYKCKSSNQYGHKYSDGMTVNVLYPPKNVSMSISPSGEMVEGSSVTLTCSGDANPPAETYSWYKVNESSPVGSGQSYSFTLSFSSSGWFYCVAQNKYGNQTAAAVSLTVNGGRSVVLYVVLGVTVGFGCSCSIIGVLFMWRKRRRGSADATSRQNVHSSPNEDTYTTLDPQTRSYNDTYDTLATVHPSPPDDTPAALESQSISPDYSNLPAARKRQ